MDTLIEMAYWRPNRLDPSWVLTDHLTYQEK